MAELNSSLVGAKNFSLILSHVLCIHRDESLCSEFSEWVSFSLSDTGWLFHLTAEECSWPQTLFKRLKWFNDSFLGFCFMKAWFINISNLLLWIKYIICSLMWGHWCQVTSTNPAFTGNLGTSHYVKLSYSAPQWINAALKSGEKKSPANPPCFWQ